MKLDKGQLVWIGGLAAGVAALVGIIAYETGKSAQAASTTTVAPPGGSTTTTPGGTTTTPPVATGSQEGVVLVGSPTGTINALTLHSGDQVSLFLPAGAAWSATNAAVAAIQRSDLSNLQLQTSGFGASTFVYTPTPADVAAATPAAPLPVSWTDVSGILQTSIVQITPHA